jgi:hypothetical protein
MALIGSIIWISFYLKKKKSKKNINEKFNYRVYKPLRRAIALIGSIVWICV